MRKSIRELDTELVRAMADATQKEANRLQAEAAQRQHEADRYRKELKRRARARLRPMEVTRCA